MSREQTGIIFVSQRQVSGGNVKVLPHHKPIVELALNNYRHLILSGPQRSLSYGQFADIIEAYYDCTTNLENREVVRTLRDVHKLNGAPVVCPAYARHADDAVGCGSTNVSQPAEDGRCECYDCGLHFEPKKAY